MCNENHCIKLEKNARRSIFTYGICMLYNNFKSRTNMSALLLGSILNITLCWSTSAQCKL